MGADFVSKIMNGPPLCGFHTAVGIDCEVVGGGSSKVLSVARPSDFCSEYISGCVRRTVGRGAGVLFNIAHSISHIYELVGL